ncbi:hypothetical protein [Bythopirellula goksoeyrii]|uniref:Uncharacterized protein n=1 Tax=Bythopirellula goksoeyrii TaxID=1400387 RepID=A0A5B9QJD6_9BACT|nr:hypothetical protein [Bythopirellula goksoeyrii]QEG34213.1 hypothetical protein Pr1d_14860 [Bythopirellula goksoeyrii]
MINNRMEKRLRMEVLEKKQLLAADLSVAVIDGDLVITGDANPNAFALRSGDTDGGQFEVVLIGPGQVDDTVNGVTKSDGEPFLFNGVTRDVIVNTGGGDDTVRIIGGSSTNELDALQFPGDLRIDLGDGEDELFMGTSASFTLTQFPLAIADDLVILGGAGNDTFDVTAVHVADDFTIVDTEGSNTLTMPLGLSFPNSNESTTIGDDFAILMGNGNDQVFVNQTIVGDNLFVDLGGGDDAVDGLLSTINGSTFVNLGSGSNQVDIAVTDAGNSLTILGSGANDVVLTQVNASSLIAVITASGDDLITLDGCTTGTGIITTGDGQDEVEIFDSAFEMLFVKLGKGDDILTLEDVEVLKLALLHGGQGNDTLVESGDIDINLELDLAFETIEDYTV